MTLPGITLSDAPTRVERFETIVVGAGVERVGRLTDVRDGRPVCEGGEPIDPRVVYFVGLRFQHRVRRGVRRSGTPDQPLAAGR